MISGTGETRDAVLAFFMEKPQASVSAHELAGGLVGLEVRVREVLVELVDQGLLVLDGERYRRPSHGEEKT